MIHRPLRQGIEVQEVTEAFEHDGRVIMIDFRPQHRSQIHGTLKFVFNSLVSWP